MRWRHKQVKNVAEAGAGTFPVESGRGARIRVWASVCVCMCVCGRASVQVALWWALWYGGHYVYVRINPLPYWVHQTQHRQLAPLSHTTHAYRLATQHAAGCKQPRVQSRNDVLAPHQHHRPHLGAPAHSGARYASSASLIKMGKARVISTGCQLNRRTVLTLPSAAAASGDAETPPSRAATHHVTSTSMTKAQMRAAAADIHVLACVGCIWTAMPLLS